MEKLPQEIVAHIQSFCNKDWVSLCNKLTFQEYLDNDPVKRLLIHWVHMKCKQDQTRRQLLHKKLEMKDPKRNYESDMQNILFRLHHEQEMNQLGGVIYSCRKESDKIAKQLYRFYPASRLEFFYREKVSMKRKCKYSK